MIYINGKSNRQFEYLYKKSTYILPKSAKVFLIGTKLQIIIQNKKINNITKYLAKSINNKINYNYRIALPITNIGSQVADEYQSIADYLAINHKLNFKKFESAMGHELVLCTFFKQLDFDKVNNLLKDVQKEMPYLINIFKQPLIHLKDIEVILPVDNVRRINHNTIRHLSRHTENWKFLNYDNDSVEPTKLLTRLYDDDYSIYENVVFRDLIDNILNFLRKQIYYLTEILKAFKMTIQLDSLNKLNHQNYYLAIGKLYIGFYQTENSDEVIGILEHIKLLYTQITKYKSMAVYAKNTHVKPITGTIKRTNILMMHRDYKHVYSLHQKFQQKYVQLQAEGSAVLQNKSQKNYELFCQMLILFAISNFNMACSLDDDIYSEGHINANFLYKNWVITTFSKYNEILDCNIIIINTKHHNNKSFSLCVIPMSYYIPQDRRLQYEIIIDRLYQSDELHDKYVFFEPFEFDNNSLNNYSIKYVKDNISLFYAVLPISISEINSFRRIQKLLLESLILSDNTYETCAFCGDKLDKISPDCFLCKRCRTTIKLTNCRHCEKSFVATYLSINNRKIFSKTEIANTSLNDLSIFYTQEREYSFRNITNLNKYNLICPHCNGENEI